MRKEFVHSSHIQVTLSWLKSGVQMARSTLSLPVRVGKSGYVAGLRQLEQENDVCGPGHQINYIWFDVLDTWLKGTSNW